ncbi:STAS domain-containing protein [Streptomyces sp. NPDC054871]
MSADYADARLRIWRTHSPPGLRLAGEVDLTNQAAFMGHLLTVNGPPTDPADVTVDLTRVTFLNFASLHALAAFASMLEPGRRLVLHTKSPVVFEIIAACGWDRPELPLTVLEEISDE